MSPRFEHHGAVVSKARHLRRRDGPWLSEGDLGAYLSLIEAGFGADIVADDTDGHHPAWGHSRVWTTTTCRFTPGPHGIIVVRCCGPLRDAILARIDEMAADDGLDSSPA